MLMVNGLTSSDIASRGFPVLDLYLAQLTQQSNKEVRQVGNRSVLHQWIFTEISSYTVQYSTVKIVEKKYRYYQSAGMVSIREWLEHNISGPGSGSLKICFSYSYATFFM